MLFTTTPGFPRDGPDTEPGEPGEPPLLLPDEDTPPPDPPLLAPDEPGNPNIEPMIEPRLGAFPALPLEGDVPELPGFEPGAVDCLAGRAEFGAEPPDPSPPGFPPCEPTSEGVGGAGFCWFGGDTLCGGGIREGPGEVWPPFGNWTGAVSGLTNVDVFTVLVKTIVPDAAGTWGSDVGLGADDLKAVAESRIVGHHSGPVVSAGADVLGISVALLEM